MPLQPTIAYVASLKEVWGRPIACITPLNSMAMDVRFIRASISILRITSLITISIADQQKSKQENHIKKSHFKTLRVWDLFCWFSTTMKISDFLVSQLIWKKILYRQTPWNFHEMDCDEPDVPMVEICGHKPKCRLTNNVFCNDIRSMRFFLHAFSAMKHDKHCLSFAFTYREMSDFQGIAWIKVNISFWKLLKKLGSSKSINSKMVQNDLKN